jgi:hypothetical protein
MGMSKTLSEQFQKPIERVKINTSDISNSLLSWLNTATSIKGGGMNLAIGV